MRLALSYAFDTLGMRAVHLRVLAFNERAIACYRRCGFREIAREPVALDTGAAEDVLMKLTVSDYRHDMNGLRS